MSEKPSEKDKGETEGEGAERNSYKDTSGGLSKTSWQLCTSFILSGFEVLTEVTSIGL